MTTISLEQYEARVKALTNSVFFRYANEADALASYLSKNANPRFDSNELFIYKVKNAGMFDFVVETTGSLVTAGA